MRVGRPSVLDVVGEAPRAAGGRRARCAGRRQLHESLYVALVRGRRTREELLEGTVACAVVHLRILTPAFPMTWRVVSWHAGQQARTHARRWPRSQQHILLPPFLLGEKKREKT